MKTTRSRNYSSKKDLFHYFPMRTPHQVLSCIYLDQHRWKWNPFQVFFIIPCVLLISTDIKLISTGGKGKGGKYATVIWSKIWFWDKFVESTPGRNPMFLVCDPRMYTHLGELMHSSLFSRAVYFRRFADPLFKQKLDNTRVDPL